MGNVKLSVIVIVHNMPRQAMNTLYSLSAAHQRNVSPDDYEVIVVENLSDNNLDPQYISNLEGNFRYFPREERGVSPVPAINFAFEMCQAPNIALLIDGARLVTPRVIEYSLMALAMDDNAIVAVPGYHLGDQDQKLSASSSHNEQVEINKLQELDWKENGYRVFQFACFCSSNDKGYFQPMQESNFIVANRSSFEAIGYADERFDLPGGGSINLHMYRQLGMLPDARLVVLPGEGCFHQFHGGVTTDEAREDRENLLKCFKEQLDGIWGGKYKALTREPMILGSVTYHAQPFMEAATKLAHRRFDRLAHNEKSYWNDDKQFSRWTEDAVSDTAENKEWLIEDVIAPEFRW